MEADGEEEAEVMTIQERIGYAIAGWRWSRLRAECNRLFRDTPWSPEQVEVAAAMMTLSPDRPGNPTSRMRRAIRAMRLVSEVACEENTTPWEFLHKAGSKF